MSYIIKFIGVAESEPQTRTYKATSPGHAFRKCLCEYPGAKLLGGWLEGGVGESHLADALRYGLGRRSGGARMVGISGL